MVFDFIEKTIKKTMKYETKWCEKLKIRNPYIDPFKVHFTPSLPMFDGTAFKKYPDLAHIYDKLWVARTQNKNAGELETILDDKIEIHFPIFIKPRYGHKSASSKGCYKIKNMDVQKIQLEELKEQNLIIDLTHYGTIDKKQVLLFKPLSKDHKRNKKSFIVVVSATDFNGFADDFIVVPSVLEAHDIIEMEEIERDLGF